VFDEPSPGPVKALLAAQGACANELRAPLTTASPALTERLLALVAALPARA
jgi:4-hydroxy-tetrahydrodipicolinate synthase